jgi:uncharacterized membrane protein YsdA (DUF1294 family)
MAAVTVNYILGTKDTHKGTQTDWRVRESVLEVMVRPW